MLYVATGKVAYIPDRSVLFAGGAVAGYFMFSHVQVRVSAWLDPWSDADGGGFQILQSLFAISEGGVAGTGLGNGSPDESRRSRRTSFSPRLRAS